VTVYVCLLYLRCLLSAPPAAPILSVVMTTNSSVQLSWMTGSNGGSRILGFVLHHRRRHSVDWESRLLSAANRSHVVSNLRCGSDYSFYLQAFNRLDKGQSSQVVHAATNGSGRLATLFTFAQHHTIPQHLGLWLGVA